MTETLPSVEAGDVRCRRAALLGALFGALTVLGISLPHTSLWGRRAMSRHTRPDFPNSAATLELEQLLSSISIDGAVLATVASNASIWADEADPRSGLLPLWLDSAQRAAISNMFVAAYDEDTLHWLRARNVPAILRTATNCSRAASWVGCAKVDLLRDVATLAFNLLLTDSDILWLKNPFPFLAAPYDLLATSEGFGADAKDPSPGPYGDMQHARVDGWPPIHYHRVPHINFGVTFARGSLRVAETFSAMADILRTRRKVWDQSLFTTLAAFPASRKHPWAGRHTVGILDAELFPTSCQLKYAFTSADLKKMEPVLVHFNCSPDRRKIMTAVWTDVLADRPTYLDRIIDCTNYTTSCRPKRTQ